MDLDARTSTSGEWLRGTGPESDIVVSSRIRLARNLAQFPFASRADDAVRSEIEGLLRGKIENLAITKRLSYVNVNSLETLDRQFLVERQLISREHAESHGSRGVGISSEENVSLMINEEDHLRIQVLRSGMALDECWSEIDRIDDAIESHVTYAFSERLGYLTAPAPVIREARALRALILRHPPGHLQRTAAYFLALGHHDALIHRMRLAYSRRHVAMADALQAEGLRVAGSAD